MSKIQPIPPPSPPSPRVWTSLDLINWTKEFFAKKGIESPRLEAELLLAEVLGVPRIRLYVDFEKPVAPEKLATFREYVKRRGDNREPLQYILGCADFIGLRLKLTPAVLIPRPETELLAVWGAERLAEAARPEAPAPAALDLCTGSGCLALYLASKQAAAHVHATDISAPALDVARENAKTLQLDARVTFHAGDLFAALPAELRGAFDLLVANPPYIDPALRATLAPEVREHEPAGALFAGEQGLKLVRQIVAEAPAWLKPGAWLGVEFGMGQADAVKKFAEAAPAYAALEIRNDSAKLPRMLLARKG